MLIERLRGQLNHIRTRATSQVRSVRIWADELEARLVTAEQRDEALEEVNSQLGQVLYWAGLAGKHKDERDEALARVADLERALGQFSAGEAATDDTTDLCDCLVSVVNEHLTGYCGTARLEASKAGTLMSTDCTCPPGWKHRAADCPFNPDCGRTGKPGQRYG